MLVMQAEQVAKPTDPQPVRVRSTVSDSLEADMDTPPDVP